VCAGGRGRRGPGGLDAACVGRRRPAPAVREQFRSAARAEISSRDLQQQDPPVSGRLGEISAPASLLVGDADYPPLIEAGRQAAARIPGCELTVVPGMDHLPPLREPDLVLRVIKSTLSRAGWLKADHVFHVHVSHRPCAALSAARSGYSPRGRSCRLPS